MPIVVVHVGAVKIYVASVEAIRKKERQGETQCTTKIGGKFGLGSQLFRFYQFFIPSYIFDALHIVPRLAVLRVFFEFPQEGPLETIPNINF
jgi:hypothetical protein